MWPKAFAQFVELAPHISRLLPLADRFLKDKAAGENATQKAMEAHKQSMDAMAAGLRSDMGQLSAFHDGLQRQILDMDKHLSAVRADALAAKVATESVEERLTRIVNGQKRINLLFWVLLVLLVGVLIVLLAPYLHGH